MKKNGLEWSVFGISLAIVGSVIGFVIRDCAVDRGLPPILRVRLDEPEQAGDAWRVPFTVTN
ncbi:hypothetical protein EON81_24990, partial [bacterium]